jgi:hypothetical protein
MPEAIELATAVSSTVSAHVGDGGLDRVLGHPVDTRDDSVRRTGPVVVEHPHADDLRGLRDTVRAACDSARDMRAVAVAVLRGAVVVDGVVAVGGAAAEVGVGDPDAGVDDVRGDARAGAVRVGVRRAERQARLVDPVQAPGRVGLGGGDADLLVLDHLGDRGVGGEPLGLGLAHLGGVAVERLLVGALDLAAVLGGQGLALLGVAAEARVLVEDDDVAVLDGAFRVGAEDHALGGYGCRGRGGDGRGAERHDGGRGDDARDGGGASAAASGGIRGGVHH